MSAAVHTSSHAVQDRPLKTALRRVLAATAAGAALAMCSTSALAAVDFSGFWVLQGDPMAVPAAASTPAAARRVKELVEARGLDAPAGSPEYARIWCTPEGIPYVTTHTLPFNVRQGPVAMAITYSLESAPRHIYLDGQPHPDEDVYDFTSTGHSIGRWQGDTLVTSTRFFKDGILVIPGGALRTEKSRLTERWSLIDQNTLQVRHTWTDPDTLRRPHSYSYTFKRAEGVVWMTEPQCTSVRAARQKGLHVPFDAPQ